MKKVGVALSGGAARCVAHLGVLDVFNKAGVPIHLLSGTSGGGLVGALYASGRYSIDELIRRVSELKWRQVTRPVVSRCGLLSSDRIGGFVRQFIGNATFDQMAIPLAVVATDMLSGKKAVLQEGEVSTAVQASCSLPIVFKPTMHGGRLLIDGGYVSQIPVLAAKEALGADFVIAVDVNYGGMDGAGTPQNMIQIAIHLASLWARKNAEEEERYADGLVRVNVSGIGLTDLHQGPELLKRGRLAAQASLPWLEKRLAGLS
ncbi:MAG: patatin-like phospholipase family protein [Nitrospirae bacterium]|nr:patatin-like phospholipase family protein [Nitrospirota bacterium]